MDQDGPDPTRHVPLVPTAWNAEEARAAVQEIVADTAAHLRHGGLWPAHPQDDGAPDDAACLYLGGAGVVSTAETNGCAVAEQKRSMRRSGPGLPDSYFG